MKVSSCCGAEISVFRDYESLKEYFRCFKCGESCQLVDKPVEPEVKKIVCPQNSLPCNFSEDNKCPNCPAYEPAQSLDLDKEMPLVYPNTSFKQTKQQHDSDKAITARLLKEAKKEGYKQGVKDSYNCGLADLQAANERIKELETINEQHRVINGELRIELRRYQA